MGIVTVGPLPKIMVHIIRWRPRIIEKDMASILQIASENLRQYGLINIINLDSGVD